jgi:hypothetical protein
LFNNVTLQEGPLDKLDRLTKLDLGIHTF